MSFTSRIREWWNGKQETSMPHQQQVIYAPPELIAEIHRLKEQADWLGSIADEEAMFTYGTDGTIQFGMSQGQPGAAMFSYPWAYSQSLFRPNYGACFFINEAQHRIIRARSRAFSSINPYWHGCQHNLKTHIVGKGHSWNLVARDPSDSPAKPKLRKGQQELDNFYYGRDIYADYGPYRQIQTDKCDRKSRDGEYFLQFLYEGKGNDRHLRVRFIEPLTVWTPASSGTVRDGMQILFGIQFKRGDYENPLRYHVRTTDYLGSQDGADYLGHQDGFDSAWSRGIEAAMIQHRKRNVDRGCPRGIPDTYWVQGRLEQSMRTLKAMGTLVQVRAKIAMIRKHINVLAGAVQPMLNSAAVGTATGPSGNIRNVMAYGDGSIIDTSDNAEYQFPSANIETDKIVSSVQADLQAAATSLGLADYMVSGNLTKGSFATAMVAEGPVVKTFEQEQQDMIDEDFQVATNVLKTAAESGRIDEDTLDVCQLEMNGPPLAGRNAIQDAQANQIKVQCGVLSVPTWQHQEGLNPEIEEANKKLSPSPVAMGPAQAGAGGEQPRNRQTSNARPFSASEEPRQQQRASGATREEADRLKEGSYEPHPKDMPSQAELEMAAVFITPEWMEKTKGEIQALRNGTGSPREWTPKMDWEPGIQSVFLGTVDSQEVLAVDASAVMIAHDAMDFVVAGNHMRWEWIAHDEILVDWSYAPIDAWHDVFHEAIETRLMAVGRWSYALAHKIANYYERQWLLVIRPELAAIKPKESIP